MSIHYPSASISVVPVPVSKSGYSSTAKPRPMYLLITKVAPPLYNTQNDFSTVPSFYRSTVLSYCRTTVFPIEPRRTWVVILPDRLCPHPDEPHIPSRTLRLVVFFLSVYSQRVYWVLVRLYPLLMVLPPYSLLLYSYLYSYWCLCWYRQYCLVLPTQLMSHVSNLSIPPLHLHHLHPDRTHHANPTVLSLGIGWSGS